MSLPTHTLVIPAEVRRLVELWKPRLGISERIAIEMFLTGDPEARCSMKPARMIPEAQGLWDFVLEWSEDVHPDDAAHTVVHELTHLLLEPLREAIFAKVTYPVYRVTDKATDVIAGISGVKLDYEEIGGIAERDWETVIQRVADAYERAYPFDGM